MAVIPSSGEKLRLLEADLEEKEAALKTLNERINRLTDEITRSGCTIVHAMGLDFEIRNDRAEFLQNKLDKIGAHLRAHDRYEPVKDIFEEE